MQAYKQNIFFSKMSNTERVTYISVIY